MNPTVKKYLVYLILISLLIPVIPTGAEIDPTPGMISYGIENIPFEQQVNITETAQSVTVDNGLSYTVELYKGSTGYDILRGINGTVLVHSQRYTVEALDKSNWKQVGIPTGLNWTQDSPTEITVTRYYTDYLGTTIDVVYHFRAGEGVKVDVVVDSGETRDYRIVWELDGITQTQVNESNKSVKFGDLKTDTWIGFDWDDAYKQFGDIDSKTVSSTAHGRKLDVVFTMGTIVEGEILTLDPVIIDSYSETNVDSYINLAENHPSVASFSAMGQSFTVTTECILDSVKFYLKKTGNPTGNAHAVLYAHNNTYGTNSSPLNPALATSDDFDVTGIGAGVALHTLTFSGAQRVTMSAATYYCIAFENPSAGIDGTNYPQMGRDNSAPSHDGNGFVHAVGVWVGAATYDTAFYVYATGVPVNDALDSDATFNRDVEGWSNVTVSHFGGVADLATVDIQVIMVGGQNFTLRWTQSSGIFSEVEDDNNVCTLNTTASVRENQDSDTDKIAFRFAISSGTDGLCNVTVTSTDDFSATDVDTYVDEFTYSTYSWTGVYDLIDSAFDQFFGGVFNFMAQVRTYLTGLMAYFVVAMTDMLSLVVQMFRVVNNTFSFCIDWLTRIITMFIAIFDIILSILDGTGDITTGLGDIWVLFAISDWIDLIPIALLIAWMESIDNRANTQGVVSSVLGDISMVFNLINFFVQWFSFAIDTVINLVMMLIDTIPGL